MLQEETCLLAPSLKGFERFLSCVPHAQLAKPAGRIGINCKSKSKEDVICEVVAKCQVSSAQDRRLSPLYFFLSQLNAALKHKLCSAMGCAEQSDNAKRSEKLSLMNILSQLAEVGSNASSCLVPVAWLSLLGIDLDLHAAVVCNSAYNLWQSHFWFTQLVVWQQACHRFGPYTACADSAGQSCWST